MRRRSDGTLTCTTEEWDARWYWPVGTRVSVQVRTKTGIVTEPGSVAKANSVSATVVLDSGRVVARVPVAMLTRMSTCRTVAVGAIVRYAQPEPGEAALTFAVLELRGDRVLLESRDFPNARIKPTEVVALSAVTAVDPQHTDDAMYTCVDCGAAMLAWQRDQHICPNRRSE
jgi:hypothetical protein